MRSPASTRLPTLNDAERQAAACFGPRLREAVVRHAAAGGPTLVLAHFPASIEGAGFRLVAESRAGLHRDPGEVELACLPEGLPASVADRRALAVRLASAAAGVWRQRYHMQRLGLAVG